MRERSCVIIIIIIVSYGVRMGILFFWVPVIPSRTDAQYVSIILLINGYCFFIIIVDISISLFY